MRQWLVDPAVLCRKHLLGEHVESHMMAGALKAGKSVGGFIRDGLYDLSKLAERHEELAGEMRRRGYSHQSPLIPVVWQGASGKVDVAANYAELSRRCLECAKLIKEAGK